MTTEEMKGCAPIAVLSIAKSHPSPTHAGRRWWTLSCLSVCCTVPLYSQWRGDPCVYILPVHIPKHYGQQNQFQLWFTGLGITGPGTVRGSHPSFFQEVYKWGSPCRKSCSSYLKMCPCVHICQCMSMYEEYLYTVTQTHLRIKTKIMKFLYAFKKSTFNVDLSLFLGLYRTWSKIRTTLKVTTNVT